MADLSKKSCKTGLSMPPSPLTEWHLREADAMMARIEASYLRHGVDLSQNNPIDAAIMRVQALAAEYLLSPSSSPMAIDICWWRARALAHGLDRDFFLRGAP